MTVQEIFAKYLDETKSNELLKELKQNNLHFANEENLDIRYGKLKDDMEAKNKLYEEAQKHIEELSKGVKSGEELKAKQSEYEHRIAELENELKQTKINSELKQALSEANAADIDYAIYKISNRLKSEEKELELDNNGKIKGIEEIISKEKQRNANLFNNSSKKEVEVREIGKSTKVPSNEPKSLLEALQQHYNLKQPKI